MTNNPVSCFCSLKAGMITYGVIMMVCVGLSIIGIIRFLIAFEEVESNLDINEETDRLLRLLQTFCYVGLAADALWVLFGVFMFIPTCSQENQSSKRWFLMPWIIINILTCVGGVAGVIMYLSHGAVTYGISYALGCCLVLWGTILSITYFKSLESSTSSRDVNPYYKMQQNA